MTTTTSEGNVVTVSLEVSVEYDPERAGFLVCEKDGPFGHVIKWGPMPGFLVQALIRERSEFLATAWRRMADDLLQRRPFPDMCPVCHLKEPWRFRCSRDDCYRPKTPT